MRPLSQEMSISHGLCLLQEKQWATWEYSGSHDLYQRFLFEPIRCRGVHLWREWVYALLILPYREVLRVNRAVCHVKVLSLYSIINPNNRVTDKRGIVLYPLKASACFKCHRNNPTLPSGCLYKCLCIPECRIGTKQPNSFTQLSQQKAPQFFGFHMLTWVFGSRKHVTRTVDALCKPALDRRWVC